MTERKGKTLWEIMVEKLFGSPEPPPPHTQLANPLNLKLGQFVNLDVLDYRGVDFQVEEIHAYKVVKAGKPFNFTEYAITGGNRGALLRVIPTSSGIKALVLEEYDGFGADTDAGKAVSQIVREDPEFNVDNDERNIHEKYFRVDDVKDSYLTDITLLTSEGFETVQVEYWDYWRTATVDGVDLTQYLYVEQNRDNGWILIKRGAEVDPNRVSVF